MSFVLCPGQLGTWYLDQASLKLQQSWLPECWDAAMCYHSWQCCCCFHVYRQNLYQKLWWSAQLSVPKWWWAPAKVPSLLKEWLTESTVVDMGFLRIPDTRNPSAALTSAAFGWHIVFLTSGPSTVLRLYGTAPYITPSFWTEWHLTEKRSTWPYPLIWR